MVVQLPEQQISLYVHPALVEQAIFNVLENAANFSPPDEPVMIRAQLSSEDEVKLKLKIEVREFLKMKDIVFLICFIRWSVETVENLVQV